MISLLLLSLGLLALILQHNQLLQRVAIGLSAIVVTQQLMTGFADDSSLQLIQLSLVAISTLSLLLSFINKTVVRYSGIVVSLIALIPIGAKATYFDFEIDWTLSIGLLPFLGALVPMIAQVNGKYAKKWFAGNAAQMERAASFVMMGIFAFISTFIAGYFGVFLVGLGWLASGLVAKKNHQLIGGLIFITIAWLFHLVKSTELVPDVLLRGNLFFGIFVGAGLIPWMLSFTAKATRIVLGVLLPLLLVCSFVAVGLLNENFGGLTVLVGALIGSSVALLSHSKTNAVKLLGLLLVLIGLTQPFETLLKPKKIVVNSLLSKKPTDNLSEEDAFSAANPINLTAAQAGKWKSVLGNSRVSFLLGPDGNKTEGAFKEFQVAADFDNEGKPTNLSVILQTSSLTTFNDLRDESVLGADYINVAKNTTASFQSEAIRSEGDSYLVAGKLSFFGVTEPVSLKLKFLSAEKRAGKEYLIFIGESTVDRSAHGMKSDAKIGNIVKVSFEIALEKQ